MTANQARETPTGSRRRITRREKATRMSQSARTTAWTTQCGKWDISCPQRDRHGRKESDMRVTGRILAVVLALVSATFLAAALAGIAGVWVVKGPLTARAGKAFD